MKLDSSVRIQAKEIFISMQERIIGELRLLDPAAQCVSDHWKRNDGLSTGEVSADLGGGHTRILSKGAVIEQGGVNFSEVYGPITDDLKNILKSPDGESFYATGTSLVIHPYSPQIPTVHCNLRLITVGDHGWFGGGMDLTPFVINEDAFSHFHRTIKSYCDRHNHEYYPKFKKWCDDYFYLSHRQEARGIGGIFFDYLGRDQDINPQIVLQFVGDLVSAFCDAYLPIMKENREAAFTDDQKHYQLIRRGRYVEFNLLHDRGTKFGLQSNGRTESILMSLPPTVKWEYGYKPPVNSDEAKLEEIFRTPREWAV